MELVIVLPPRLPVGLWWIWWKLHWKMR